IWCRSRQGSLLCHFGQSPFQIGVSSALMDEKITTNGMIRLGVSPATRGVTSLDLVHTSTFPSMNSFHRSQAFMLAIVLTLGAICLRTTMPTGRSIGRADDFL